MTMAETLSPETERLTPVAEDIVAVRGITKVLIGGFDNAGKSTLACSLYEALNHEGVETSLYELDRWSDTHDLIFGRKTWAERNKRTDVTMEEYRDYANGFVADRSQVVLGDLEGRYQSGYIPILKGQADFGILVTREPIPKDERTQYPQNREGWEQLFDRLNVPIAAHVRSLRHWQNPPADTLPIIGLEREPIPENHGVKKLARLIMARAGIIDFEGARAW